MLLDACLSFFVSLAATLLLVRSASRHGHLSGDTDIAGPQKFHTHPVSRIGGVGIAIGLMAGLAGLSYRDGGARDTAMGLLVCGIPAFGAGLAEDLTKKVSPAARLAAAAVSAALGIWLLDALVARTGLPGLDWVVSFGIGAFGMTLLTVSGIANAVNIVDGFNGLASMCVMMMLLALAYVAWQTHDLLVMRLALLGCAAVLGFFVLNFPAGLIFLGDGGAYFLGYYLAELGILLVVRNPDVSPMFPLLMCIYPVFETLFSIYRKKVIRGMSPGRPDGVHLHMLVYKRLLRRSAAAGCERSLVRRNSMTSPFLWALCLLAIVPSVVFWRSTPWLCAFIVMFGIVYVFVYWRIVRFKVPRNLAIGKR